MSHIRKGGIKSAFSPILEIYPIEKNKIATQAQSLSIGILSVGK